MLMKDCLLGLSLELKLLSSTINVCNTLSFFVYFFLTLLSWPENVR